MSHHRGLYRSGYITVDVSEFLDAATDDDLVDEITDRGLSTDGTLDRDYAERALEALRQRRFAEAEALLDRAIFPHPTHQEMKGLVGLFGVRR